MIKLRLTLLLMNEQRQQAYLNLIRSLLDSPSSEEAKILAANKELLDTGFVQTIQAEAQRFSQQGDKNTANRLQSLVMQVGEALNLDTTVDLQSLSKDEIQAYFQFLMKVLKATVDNKGDAQVIDPLLAKNTDKLDGVLAEILHRWGTEKLGQAEENEAQYLANNIIKFSNLIEQFPLGNKAWNMEIAIIGYQIALTVFTRDAFPSAWAGTQYFLGVTYRKRIKGKKTENIEKAIDCLQESLKILTPNDFPYQWAGTQNALGLAYLKRIKGKKIENIEKAIDCFQKFLTVHTPNDSSYDWAVVQLNLGLAYGNRIKGENAENQAEKAENIEKAIDCFRESLKILTPNNFPYECAMTQNALGNAYGDRIKKDKAKNIEKAIGYYRESLKILTPNDFPYDWAYTQNILGITYRTRITGDKAKNIELAINCFQESLKVYIPNDSPYNWAWTQNNLGNAYREKIQGGKAENIELAIGCFQESLKVYTSNDSPYDWVMVQVNLGVAYLNRIQGKKVENIELAIYCFQESLKVYTPNDSPYDWARIQNNLGAAYLNRIQGEKVENIELALAYLQEALKIYTFDAFPHEWAGTQNNLGNPYRDRSGGDSSENLKQAIVCYQDALKVYTFDAFPQNYAESLWKLGIAYQNTKQFTLAYNTFESAIATVESLREEIVSGEESKRKQAEQFNEVYSCMVEVCRELNKITEAIEYVERSKTRNLVEQILERDSKTFFPPEVVTQLEKYRDEIATGQKQIQNGKAENPQTLAQHLQKLRQQRNELQNQYLPVGYGFKFDSFQGSLDEHTAIIEWYILNDKILAFIVTKQGEVTVCQSQPEDQQALIDWANKYLQNYYGQKDQWLNNLGKALKELASILHIDEILTQIPKHCDKLILIPHRFLHLFPLHALPINQNYENSSCLLDLFAGGVSYAPSCQLLQQVQQRQRPDFQSLFAIQNPTEDLNYTNLEVESILSYFPSHQVLSEKQATKCDLSKKATQLKKANYLHFSCHGSFNFNSPQNSFLLLADAYVSPIPDDANPERYLKVSDTKAIDLSKCLTLGNLFERIFDFSQTRLVVLSACETGLTDFNNTSDEYIGLPSGFLYAGSSSVVSSLWTVNDLSTSFLMIKFIQNLQDTTDMLVPLAMNQAQQWLRDVTKEELQEWVKKLTLDSDNKGKIRRQINHKMTGEKPFNSPYYWAAFTAVGK